MKRWRQALLVTFTLIIYSLNLASAQYVLATYDLDKLSATPGPLMVSTNFSAVVKFDAPVDYAVSSRDDLITYQLMDDVIIVRANKPVGTTDLIVSVNGKIALFTVTIDSSLASNHNYEVAREEAAQVTSATELRPGTPSRLLPRDTVSPPILTPAEEAPPSGPETAPSSDTPTASTQLAGNVLAAAARGPQPVMLFTTGATELQTLVVRDNPDELKLIYTLKI